MFDANTSNIVIYHLRLKFLHSLKMDSRMSNDSSETAEAEQNVLSALPSPLSKSLPESPLFSTSPSLTTCSARKNLQARGSEVIKDEGVEDCCMLKFSLPSSCILSIEKWKAGCTSSHSYLYHGLKLVF